jgi:hypothetical protein
MTAVGDKCTMTSIPPKAEDKVLNHRMSIKSSFGLGDEKSAWAMHARLESRKCLVE